ncbi:MAG: GNAT family N-acetyltransferase [Beijerinckiaceae bacterium]
MSASAVPKPALRPYLASDAPLLAQIFRDSIAELTSDDYDEAQQAAWIARADDEARFAESLATSLTLVATIAHAPVGFVSLDGGDHIDKLYVHPSMAREGIGMLLCDAIEKVAQARGAARLTTDASDTARPLFERRGFEARHRQTVALGTEWLGNTRMEKQLEPSTRRDQSR